MSILANGDFAPGRATTQWLASIGFSNIRDVARTGVVETCLLLRRAGHPVSLNMAYGLQADLMGTTWDRLPDMVRDELRRDYDAVLRQGCQR
jgi:hypothetical protein